MISLVDALRPPSEEEVARALALFAADLRRHYGERLVALWLFGSRARGDHGPDATLTATAGASALDRADAFVAACDRLIGEGGRRP